MLNATTCISSAREPHLLARLRAATCYTKATQASPQVKYATRFHYFHTPGESNPLPHASAKQINTLKHTSSMHTTYQQGPTMLEPTI